MADEYVSKSLIIREAKKSPVGVMLIQRYNLEGFIKGLPGASVRPDIHAEWSVKLNHSNYDDWYDCTCGWCEKTFKHFNPSNFCPDCGATMHWDGELE